MGLVVLPLVESDLSEFVRIALAAFSTNGMTALLKPSPIPSDYHEKTIEKHLKSFREEPDVHYLKVIDTELGGRIIACAKWRINRNERTEDQIKSMLPVPGLEEEGRPAAQDFYWYLNWARREFMGTKPFFFLHVLITDPEHHRRGAGAMLIQWGTSQADDARLPSFLEATLIGRPLYARMGFEPRHEEVFDLTKYGLQGTDTTTVMIREPSVHAV
ncbi:hypothetical protein GQ44DRAFT_822446 [Phaeosphaeriaceae sp. PMI808]|nr:hypothetical protein GQ44DRAFT_822446 [Phaeosphaeriaceae sp. PMI808]